MASPEVKLTLLHPDACIPSYAHHNDAGADLTSVEDVTLQPGERRLVHTGIAIALPDDLVALVHPRSGLALKHGIGMVNAPGTIDAGYRGEIMVLLINHDQHVAVTLPAGTRIAQLVIQEVLQPTFRVVEALPESVRAAGGFGSTGTLNVTS
jgi:dUTP pyrophosphatase